MKINRSKTNSGSVLVAALIFALLIATALVSYLLLVQNSDQAVARAQRWNSALAIAEAGIEEALAKLSEVSIATNSTSTNFTLPQRSFNILNYNGTYNASVANGVTNVIITSSGAVTAPITGDTITRTVRVTAARLGLTTKGIVSMTYIDFKGNGVAVDSYSSLLGPYNPNSPGGTNGDVAALDGIVDLGNHTIAGDLYLGPDSTFKSNRGQVTGSIYNDWHMQFPEVSLPTKDVNGFPITWTPAPGTTSHNFTNSGYYIISDNGSISVDPGVIVTLDVRQTSYTPSGLTIKGGATPSSGTVVMYQRSGTLTLNGSAEGGAINNRPQNFVYFGLPGVTSITFGGSSSFVGVIFAPQADLTFNGGGSDYNFMGSLIVKSMTMKGHYNFHYDTSLAGYYYGYYVVDHWQEL